MLDAFNKKSIKKHEQIKKCTISRNDVVPYLWYTLYLSILELYDFQYQKIIFKYH